MKTGLVSLPVCLIALILLAGTSMAEQVYLEANFNDKMIDDPIGTGGADLGEPVDVDTDHLSAIVRDGPMGSPSLEIADAGDFTTGYVDFEFIGNQEITTGLVYIAADLWFDTALDGEEAKVRVYEQGSRSNRFTEMGFQTDGDVWLHYGASSNAGIIGTFTTGEPFRVIQEFDMDAGTFSVWLDGELVLEDLVHGVTGDGVGSVIFGVHYDEDTDGHYYVDAIKVADTFEAIPVEEQSWGRIKAGYR